MPENSLAAAFLKSLRTSGLIAEDELAVRLKELREAKINEKNAFALSDAFVERRWLTRWQADMLLDGKHRGFHLGKYRLLSQLGRGGMGVVYLAEHTLMRRRCAIKVLPPRKTTDTANLARFEREAHAIAALNHVNIVRAYDFDREQDRENVVHFLVMEYVDGSSLDDRIAENGPLAPSNAADLIRQAAEGLAHAHGLGMIHRDIKPANLLVDPNGCLKILDLGLARCFHDLKGDGNVPEAGNFTGTVDYLSPEQAIDSDAADARTDIYALGCTLYHLLAGRPPFPEGTIPQRLIDHQSRIPTPIEQIRSEVPPSLGTIVRKMMAKKPDERFQTASDVAATLNTWLGENGAAAPGRKRSTTPVPPTKPAPAKSSKKETVPATPAPNPFAGIPLESRGSRRNVGGSGENWWGNVLPWPPNKKQIPAFATAAAAIAILFLVLIYWLLSGSDARTTPPRAVAKAGPTDPSNPKEKSGTPAGAIDAKAQSNVPAAVEKTGPTGDVTVGPNGNFKTLGDAFAHVKRQFSPLNRTQRRTITVESGQIFNERIDIDNSDLTFPNGVSVVCKGPGRAVLAPAGTEPIVKLTGVPKGVEQFTLEGFELRAEGKPVAIELAGFLVGTKLANLKVTGFTRTGLTGKGTVGIGVKGSVLLIERCNFLGREESTGIRLAAGDDNPAHIAIQNCRFSGPMKGGIALRETAIDIAIRDSAFYRLEDALAFEGSSPEWRDIAVEDNTFLLGSRGIVFHGVPSARSSGLAFRNNVFADLTTGDCVIEGKLDERAFLALLASNGLANNWTDRPAKAASGGSASAEFDLIQGSGRRGADIDFASTDPESGKFLHPADGAQNSAVGVRAKK